MAGVEAAAKMVQDDAIAAVLAGTNIPEDKTFTHRDIGYVPSIRLIHDEKGRRYERPLRGDDDQPVMKKDGTQKMDRFRSVTAITGSLATSGIQQWRQAEINRRGFEEGMRHCDNHSKESIDVGNAMHLIIERYMNNQPAPILGQRAEDAPDLAFNPFVLFKMVKPFLNRLDNIRAVEVPLISEHLHVAGTTDLIAEFDGELVLVDHKNSRKPKRPSNIRQYILQEVVYASMWRDLTGEEIKYVITNMAIWDPLGARQYIYELTPELEAFCLAKFEQLMGAESFLDNLGDIPEFIPKRPIKGVF